MFPAIRHENGSLVIPVADTKVHVPHLGECLYVAGVERDVFGDMCFVLKGATGVALSELFSPCDIIAKWEV